MAKKVGSGGKAIAAQMKLGKSAYVAPKVGGGSRSAGKRAAAMEKSCGDLPIK